MLFAQTVPENYSVSALGSLKYYFTWEITPFRNLFSVCPGFRYIGGPFRQVLLFHNNPSRGSPVVPCRRTDMTKLVVAFRSVSNAPKTNTHYAHGVYLCSCMSEQTATFSYETSTGWFE